MKAVAFLGPSLPQSEAREITDAILLPPARRGDVVRAIAEHDPEVILIIDGYFEQVPSVWHKEILWALQQGRTVAGAASMGALRAAELAQFGMIGVGRIFEAYLSGRFDPFDDPFEDDDEVAVLHGPAETGYAATEAMVDIRATLAAARADGVIATDDMIAVAATAKAQFYKRRTWGSVLSSVRDLGEDTRTALQAWMRENRVQQKRLDATQLLGQNGKRELAADLPPFRFEQTLLWESELPKILEDISGRVPE